MVQHLVRNTLIAMHNRTLSHEDREDIMTLSDPVLRLFLASKHVATKTLDWRCSS